MPGGPSISHRFRGNSGNHGWKTTVLSFHCLSFLASHSYASPKPFFPLTFLYHSDVNLFSGIGPWLTHHLLTLLYSLSPFFYQPTWNTLFFFIQLQSPVVLMPLSANVTEKKDAGNRLCFHICDWNLPYPVPEKDFHFSILWSQSVLPLVKRQLLQINITHVFIQN